MPNTTPRQKHIARMRRRRAIETKFIEAFAAEAFIGLPSSFHVDEADDEIAVVHSITEPNILRGLEAAFECLGLSDTAIKNLLDAMDEGK